MRKQPSSQVTPVFFLKLRGIVFAYDEAMNVKPLLFGAIAGAALLGWLAAPDRSSGEGEGEARALDALLIEIAAQQTVAAENQLKIDEKLTAVSEEIRLARIYAGRAGGKAQ